VSQVFISYASEDRPWVESFARTLEGQGWTVWWDRQIPTGQTYDNAIWSALQAASCVVVVWSSHSIGKEWVKEEAGDAKNRNILFPIRIEDVQPPFGFGLRQVQSLIGWHEGDSHPGYDQLLRDIGAALKEPRPTPDADRSSSRARLRPYLWLIVPTLLVATLVAALMMWRVPTHVRVELVVDRVQFEVGQIEGGWKNLMGPLDVEAIIFSRFAKVHMSPKSVDVADPKQYDAVKNAFIDVVWRPVRLTQDSLQFEAGDVALRPTVTIQADPPKASTGLPAIARAGRLDAVSVVGGSTVILHRGGGAGASVTAEILAETPKANLTPPPAYWVIPHHTTVQGVTAPAVAESAGRIYRVSPKAGNPSVIVEGEAKALAVSIRPVAGATQALEGGTSIPITAINLFKQNRVGLPVSTLTEKQEAVITYPDYADLTAVKIVSPDLLAIDDLDRVVITQIEWSTTSPGIRLVLDGRVGHVASMSGEFQRDHRLTRYDELLHNTQLVALLAILAWVVPTLIGARKLLKEYR
jgi:hypothetical protein